MCGIAGAVADGSSAIGREVAAMTRALRHRGPDGEGYWRLGDEADGRLVTIDQLARPSDLVLGHRRLSIVDIAGGGQPLSNEDGTVWVSFNGEIYNQLDLRHELESLGHRFVTRADTEVLVHGWEEWGPAVFERLNGIFALALADTRSREVVLARDPMGVKPLFVGRHGRSTWWASELSAAASAGLLPSGLSADSLKLLLTFRFIPSPYSILEGVWKLPPGSYCRITSDRAGTRPQFVAYHTRVRSSADPQTRSEWGAALMEELDRAVARQLMADVPVSSLLSGGVDSSLLTQMMMEHLPYAPVTYGIGFGSDGPAGEAEAALHAARVLGTSHNSQRVDDQSYVDAWPEALARLGEPIANSSALLVELICRSVGRTHKVALCGQGADEPLGGYPRHMAERLAHLGRLAPRLSVAATSRLFGADSGARLSRALSAVDRVDRYVQIFSVFPNETVDALVRGASSSALELARGVVEPLLVGERDVDTLNELLRVDARLSLADDLLLVADHMSMASSVELRVPFLDLAFVDIVERMPSRYKVSRLGERKWLYRKAASQRLPPSLARELCPPTKRLQAKRGFSAPVSAWFETQNGLLARTESWSEPLYALGQLYGSGLDTVLRRDAPDSKRERTTLFSLAKWLEVRDVDVRSAA